MTETTPVLLVIFLMALVTLILRALPFMAGRWLRRHALVQRLGDHLPLSIMVLLAVDALAGQARGNPAGLWQELLAVTVVAALQWRWRHPLLSIAAGTALYVVLRAG